jgi:hypothetical protein
MLKRNDWNFSKESEVWTILRTMTGKKLVVQREYGDTMLR